jgi:hypothetical protein
VEEEMEVLEVKKLSRLWDNIAKLNLWKSLKSQSRDTTENFLMNMVM